MGEITGSISYEELRKLVFDYFSEHEGIDLGSISIDYLKAKLQGGYSQPFFIRNEEFGEVRFDVPKEDLERILGCYLASKGKRLISVNYGSTVGFTYEDVPDIKVENVEKPELFIYYPAIIDYDKLRSIVIKHYKEKKGITLKSIVSTDYWPAYYSGDKVAQPFFAKDDEFGESRFHINEEEMNAILTEYLAELGYDLKSLWFDDKVRFIYQPNKELKKAKVEPKVENPFVGGTKNDEPTKEPKEEEVKPEAHTETPVEELARMAREGRRFNILQRERAMNDAQRARNRAAIMAGLCMLGAAAGVLFNGQDPSVVIQHELSSIYSWEALVQYLQDLGPATTLLTAGAVGFITRYIRHNRRFRDAQHQFEDFNASLENNNTEELGGNSNARTR